MSPELLSILVLVAMFVIATVTSVNLGVMGIAAAFLVGIFLADFTTDDVLGSFPGDLFITLAGITYLFGLASTNGTVDWLVHASVRAVGGRIVAVPWVMFGIAGVLTAIGALSPAAVAIVAPIALGLAAQYQISPLLMGLLVVHGAQAGGFSPISIYGGIVNDVVVSSGLERNQIAIFLASLVVNLIAGILVFVLLGGRALIGRRHDAREGAAVGAGSATAERRGSADTGGRDDHPARGRGDAGGDAHDDHSPRSLTRDQSLTLLGLVVLAVITVAWEDADAGLIAFAVGVVLTLLSPASAKGAVEKIAWPTVLLVCGVLTYVTVLEEMGTIDYAGEAVAGVGAALVAAVLLCYVGGVASAFASSTALLGVLIPLAVPLINQGGVDAVAMVAALSVSSTIVDVSPFSTNGALVLANAQGIDPDRFYRQLLIYGAVVVAVAPLLIWLAIVVPGWG